MKYLTVIYFDTFARFFHAIEDEVKDTDPNAEFLHLSIFPSGWAYLKTRRRKTRLLPLELLKPNTTHIDVSVADLRTISNYHAVVGAHSGRANDAALRRRSQRYVDTIARIIDNFRPDVVLLSGDTRIACEAMRYHLKASHFPGPVFYFEQGPNGTTMLDRQGVNANASFRFLAAELTGQGYEPEAARKLAKYKRNPIYRATDYAVIALLRVFGKLPPEWDTMRLGSYPEYGYAELTTAPILEAPVPGEVLVALQVPDDANNIHHNPLKLNDHGLLQWVLTATESLGWRVRVREHPLYKRKYSAELYDLLGATDRAILSAQSLADDLSAANAVVTINSTTGLDAYLQSKPVVVLGNAYYDHLPGIRRAADQQQLTDALDVAAAKGGFADSDLDPRKVFAELKARYLLPGHYQDADLTTPALIARELVAAGEAAARDDR
ncbi:MAG: hypothetical protein QM621_07335 [Aeromicrobium sp.]|uniref:capsular polysaccharide export protein, LipB/KpsS family n=1 Tax=Aeromicrobium sp. TaxID=1871063 RepID=UPI0039E2F12D